ncbi:MAG: hypothetical protein IJX51_03700 [Clostridia bacterium]|nr:hypothetical protein [Clostridia bacterium]
MKSDVGVIKEIDHLGRIVIPKDYRHRLTLDKEVEIVLTSSGVLIRNPEYKLVRITHTQN